MPQLTHGRKFFVCNYMRNKRTIVCKGTSYLSNRGPRGVIVLQ